MASPNLAALESSAEYYGFVVLMEYYGDFWQTSLATTTLFSNRHASRLRSEIKRSNRGISSDAKKPSALIEKSQEDIWRLSEQTKEKIV